MMRIRSCFSFGIAAALVLTSAACARDEPADTDFATPAEETAQPGYMDDRPADLVSAQEAYLAAWNGSDPAALAAFFTDDARATVGDNTYTGIAEIRDRWAGENVAAVSDLESEPESFNRVGDDYVEEGTYSHTLTPPEGDVQTVTGRYNVTWTRSADGQWRIRSSTVTPDAM
ncbi:MAG TPA: nuclear transport factor 2 family protein [Longimicrobiales bacterium]|nr:nuclear transport factor 2 family protein [Longimicrobiales bacterium]